MINIPKLFRFRRHKPRTSKSRWKKLIEKRHRERHPGCKIIEAHPKSPFMTVQYFPKTEEEQKAVQEENMRTLLIGGIGAIAVPSLLKMLKKEA